MTSPRIIHNNRIASPDVDGPVGAASPESVHRASPGAPGARSPRGRRGAIATLTALLGVLVAAAGAVEAISLAMHRRTFGFTVGRVAKYGRDTHLDDNVVLIVAIAAFAVGILLLIVALVPPKRRLIELAEPDMTIAAGLNRRSFHRALQAAALSVDGISDAKVSGRRRLTVMATTSFRNSDALPGRVRDRVIARLDELDPVKSRTLRVHLNRKDA